MKHPIPLLLLMLFSWLFGLSLYQYKTGCGCSLATNAAMPPTVAAVASKSTDSITTESNAVSIKPEVPPLIRASSSPTAINAKRTITLHFKTNKNKVVLSRKHRRFFADLQKYLSENPDAQINVSGHTDNRGNEPFNAKLSKQRAEFVKAYLAANINAANIVSFGKGSEEPIADNSTIEGRSKNRRVEVSF